MSGGGGGGGKIERSYKGKRGKILGGERGRGGEEIRQKIFKGGEMGGKDLKGEKT